MADRPLSPHLQIWKWGPHMFVSIVHRITGDGMALVGLGVLVWWLVALAGGPESYASFQKIAGAWYGLLVLVGLSWAYFTHLSSGIRHFVLDIGAGYELTTNKAWSVACPLIGLIFTAAFWAVILNK